MYGPKQKYVDPFARALPKYYQCTHTHVSGRRCNRRTIREKKPCEQCAPVHGSDRYCVECWQMLKAFGMAG